MPARARKSDDRGLSTLETVFTVPVVMLMIFGVLQAGMWWYARQVALTSAQEGARIARAYGATDADGAAKTASYIEDVQDGSGPLLNPTITVDRGPTTVTVRVRGSVVSLIPGLSIDIDVTSTGPIEDFVPAA